MSDGVLRRAQREAQASSIEAAEGGFDLGIAGELPASGLRKTFKHRRQMRGVDLLGLAAAGGDLKHGTRDLILAVGWQSSHRFEGLFEKLGHGPESRGLGRRHKGASLAALILRRREAPSRRMGAARAELARHGRA